jgi:hypothetical protein
VARTLPPAWRTTRRATTLPPAGHGRPAKGGAIPEDYYVQVRYPQGRRWVAIVVSESRRDAAKLAGDAYRHLPDARGRAPTAVRIVTASNLRNEGGEAAVSLAVTDSSVRPEEG